MRVETRAGEGGIRSLILIPETRAECRTVDEALGSRVQSGDGLIATVAGEVRIADGYGPLYITLRAESTHDLGPKPDRM
jgi:hypothetical protein